MGTRSARRLNRAGVGFTAKMRQFISGLLLLAIYMGGFAPWYMTANGQATVRAVKTRTMNLPNGLTFRLSEGTEGAGTRERQLPADSSPMDAAAAARLLGRLPQIKADPSDETDFAKRLGTLPAPKKGEIIPVKFPADDQRGTPKIDPGKTVEVIRFSPEGEVALAPDLSVTFSQPMVAVTSQEQAAQYAPVELSPAVEGRWRWLGTKTLMFDTEKRFPMATKFTARVPAGTRAAAGQILEKDFTWTFTTPPPNAEQMIPAAQTVKRDALMFISFDQQINPEAVINSISVTSKGRKLPIRLVTQEEIDADPSIPYYVERSQPGRWLAFRAVNAQGGTENALPADSGITVTIGKGTPSAEGPLTTTEAKSYSFQTFGPFKVTRSFCGWEGHIRCVPLNDWAIEFNNPIDGSNSTKDMVKIEPAVEGLRIYPTGRAIRIQGYKKGRMTYKVTVDGRLKDNFGQALGQPATATIKVGPADQAFYSQGGPMVVVDPALIRKGKAIRGRTEGLAPIYRVLQKIELRRR